MLRSLYICMSISLVNKFDMGKRFIDEESFPFEVVSYRGRVYLVFWINPCFLDSASTF